VAESLALQNAAAVSLALDKLFGLACFNMTKGALLPPRQLHCRHDSGAAWEL